MGMKKIKSFLTFLWGKWKKIAYVIGLFNSRVILTVIYFLFLWPFAVVAKMIYCYEKKKVKTNWVEMDFYTKTLSEAKEQ